MDTILDNAPCGFLIVSDAGYITDINKTLLKWLGYEWEELQGKKMEAIVGIAGRIFCQTHLFPLIVLHDKAEEVFITLKTKEKNDLPVLLNAQRIVEGGSICVHYVMMPVFQRKKYEDELLNARKVAEEAILQNEGLQKAKTALAASIAEQDYQMTRLIQMHTDLENFNKVISHDMQEPVRKIAVFADILARGNGADVTPENNHAVKRISESSHYLRNLIYCLEQYVSIDMKTETMTQCDLGHLLEKARQKLLAEYAGVSIQLSHGPLHIIDGHSEQVELLFYHLLSNAVKFKRPETDEVKVKVEAAIIQENTYRTIKDNYRYANYVQLVISDDGIGFENEYRDYIFELFKKAHNTATGLGFGLALCKKIVQNHNGVIRAASTGAGGASFTILLPLKSTVKDK